MTAKNIDREEYKFLAHWEKMKLKSEIARPTVHETLEPNHVYTVSGAAWAGETEVTEIAVSAEGAQTWAEAEENKVCGHDLVRLDRGSDGL